MEQDRIISLSVWRYVILIMEAHICTCDVSPLYNYYAKHILLEDKK